MQTKTFVLPLHFICHDRTIRFASNISDATTIADDIRTSHQTFGPFLIGHPYPFDPNYRRRYHWTLRDDDGNVIELDDIPTDRLKQLSQKNRWKQRKFESKQNKRAIQLGIPLHQYNGRRFARWRQHGGISAIAENLALQNDEDLADVGNKRPSKKPSDYSPYDLSSPKNEYRNWKSYRKNQWKENDRHNSRS